MKKDWPGSSVREPGRIEFGVTRASQENTGRTNAAWRGRLEMELEPSSISTGLWINDGGRGAMGHRANNYRREIAGTAGRRGGGWGGGPFFTPRGERKKTFLQSLFQAPPHSGARAGNTAQSR